MKQLEGIPTLIVGQEYEVSGADWFYSMVKFQAKYVGVEEEANGQRWAIWDNGVRIGECYGGWDVEAIS